MPEMPHRATCCPHCGGNRTQRRSIVWQEGIGTVEHPNGAQSHRFSLMSSMHAPPQPPGSYPDQVIGALVFVASCCAVVGAAIKFLPPVYAAVVVVSTVYAATEVSRYLIVDWRLLLLGNHRNAVSAYADRLSLWRRQWACGSCGEVFIPDGIESEP